MATPVRLIHPQSGLTKTGYIGFSWTTLIWGMFPALFRGDFITFIGAFVVLVILALLTVGIGASIAMGIWACYYNRFYTRKLIEQGYMLADRDDLNLLAAQKLGILMPVAAVAA